MEFADPDEPVELANIEVAEGVIRLPKFESRDSVPDPTHWLVRYPHFLMMVFFDEKDDGLCQLPGNWGDTELARWRAIYSLGFEDVDRAGTPADLARVINGVTAKSILLTGFAKERFVEFRSARFGGFIQGSAEQGSMAVCVELFPNNAKDDRRLSLSFGKLAPGVRDADIERFVAAVEFLPEK